MPTHPVVMVVNGSLKMTHFTAKNDKVKLTHP
jgi:hypothetical protein